MTAVLGDVFKVSRPISWINTGLPFLVAGFVSERHLTAALLLGFIYFLAPYNLLLYGVNDLFDYESDRRNPRKGGSIEGGLVTPANAPFLWIAVALTNVPLLAALAVLAGPGAAGVLSVTVAVALVYSVPPLRTKEAPGLDSLTSALHFVLPAVGGAVIAGQAIEQLPWRFFGAFLLWGMASHALGAIQDVRYDRDAGIGSIAVALGARKTAVFSATLYVAATLLTASAGGPAMLAAGALGLYTILAVACLWGETEARARWAWKSFLGLNLLAGAIITRALLQAWGMIHGDQLAQLAWVAAAVSVGLLCWRGRRALTWRAIADGLIKRSLVVSLLALAVLVLVDVLPVVLPPLAYKVGDVPAFVGALAAFALFLTRRAWGVFR